MSPFPLQQQPFIVSLGKGGWSGMGESNSKKKLLTFEVSSSPGPTPPTVLITRLLGKGKGGGGMFEL